MPPDLLAILFLENKCSVLLIHHNVILAIHFLNTVFQQIIMFNIWNKQYHKCYYKSKNYRFATVVKVKNGDYCTYGKQNHNDEVHQPFMGKKSNLNQVFFDFIIPVRILFFKQFVYVVQIGKNSLFHIISPRIAIKYDICRSFVHNRLSDRINTKRSHNVYEYLYFFTHIFSSVFHKYIIELMVK